MDSSSILCILAIVCSQWIILYSLVIRITSFYFAFAANVSKGKVYNN